MEGKRRRLGLNTRSGYSEFYSRVARHRLRRTRVFLTIARAPVAAKPSDIQLDLATSTSSAQEAARGYPFSQPTSAEQDLWVNSVAHETCIKLRCSCPCDSRSMCRGARLVPSQLSSQSRLIAPLAFGPSARFKFRSNFITFDLLLILIRVYNRGNILRIFLHPNWVQVLVSVL